MIFSSKSLISSAQKCFNAQLHMMSLTWKLVIKLGVLKFRIRNRAQFVQIYLYGKIISRYAQITITITLTTQTRHCCSYCLHSEYICFAPSSLCIIFTCLCDFRHRELFNTKVSSEHQVTAKQLHVLQAFPQTFVQSSCES